MDLIINNLRIMIQRFRYVPPLALIAVVLGACGGASTSDADDHDHDDHEPSSIRLLVASDDGVEVLDGASLASLGTIDVESRPGLAAAGDGRHVFALQAEAGVVSVIDAGTWAEDHGDHAHTHTEEPSDLGVSFEGGGAYHAVADDDRAVIWFDEDGSFLDIPHESLVDGDHERFETDDAHHGVAVPWGDGFLTSVSEDETPVGVAMRDADGNETDRFENCSGLHGEAATDDGFVFGCDDGVVVAHDDHVHGIDSPVDGSGTGSLATEPGREVALGSLYHEGDDPVTDLAVYDLAEESSTTADIGTEYSSFGIAGGIGYALGTDGAVHLIDLGSGDVIDSYDVVDPWTPSDDWTDPRPQATADHDHLWISDPRDSSVTVVELETGEVLEETNLDVTPTSLLVVNPEADDH